MRPNLSDGEWKLMNRLWAHSPRTITELTAELKEETGWGKNTIITMLGRLEAKGAVRHEEGARAKRYFPTSRKTKFTTSALPRRTDLTNTTITLRKSTRLRFKRNRGRNKIRLRSDGQRFKIYAQS